MDDIQVSNFQLFRDCLATPLIEKSAERPKKSSRKSRGNGRRKTAIKPVLPADDQETNDAEELAEFIEYIAAEIFTSLPPTIRSLTYSTWLNTPVLSSLYIDPLSQATANSILNPLSPTITDSLATYNILPPHTTLTEFLTPILNTYLSTITTAPPPPALTKDKATECEICERSWIPLTYHHLIPKGVHAKVLKRGWHAVDKLMDVAWICRACHTFVHQCATNEELAKEWYTVERLMEREDVRRFAGWVGKVRWKAN